MKEYELSEQQREQARSYFFEYICQDADKDSDFENALEEKYAYIGIIAREEMPKWIDTLEKQIRKDIANGVVDRTKAENMDLGIILRDSLEELNKGNHKSLA